MLDFLKGGQVSKHMQELKSFSKKIKSLDELKEFQARKLSHIIRKAVDQSPFYNSFPKESNIIDFPILNKGDIRKDLNQFKSYKFTEEQLREVVTSGSTGLPFKVYQNAEKVDRNSADSIFMASKVNFEIGEKLIYLKIWNDFNRKSRILQKSQNIIPVDVHSLSDQKIEEILVKLNKETSRIHFLGYASALESIASYIKRSGFNVSFKVGSIITMSEAVSKNGKKIIEETMNCKVCSRYSNVENGILAQQTLIENNRFLINSASYYIEILDMYENIPLQDGQMGRIVVTDYYNQGTFMLRYDTGDIGIKTTEKINGAVNEFLLSIEGRKMDAIYNTNGELMSSFIITNGMWDYSELLQYQFVQVSEKSYLFKLNVEEKFLREKELIQEFRAFLGSDASIAIEYVNEIPLLSSGKRKKVVNLMNKE